MRWTDPPFLPIFIGGTSLGKSMANPVSRFATRLAYGASQLSRVAWYLGHGVVRRWFSINREDSAGFEQRRRSQVSIPAGRSISAITMLNDLRSSAAAIWGTPVVMPTWPQRQPLTHSCPSSPAQATSQRELGDFRLTRLAGHGLAEPPTARLIPLCPCRIEGMVGCPNAFGLAIGPRRRRGRLPGGRQRRPQRQKMHPRCHRGNGSLSPDSCRSSLLSGAKLTFGALWSIAPGKAKPAGGDRRACKVDGGVVMAYGAACFSMARPMLMRLSAMTPRPTQRCIPT
jgi:hypothetical protein